MVDRVSRLPRGGVQPEVRRLLTEKLALKDGVTSIALRLGLHAKALHDELAQDLKVNEAQFDEKWAFVGKKTEEL